MTAAPQWVTGDNLGLLYPTSLEVLEANAPVFLTGALQVTGYLGSDNAVTEVLEFREFIGGGAGRKAIVRVRYAEPAAGLHDTLFVKMPRDFGDPLRDLFSALMEPEARFALLSRTPDFPVAVPACCFADYDSDTQTGVLITQCIAYGENGNEPFFDKCLDYQIADPLPYYNALIRGIARLAAAHKGGFFGDEVERQFPYEPSVIRDADLIPYTPEQLDEKLQKLISFAGEHPHLFPAHLRTPVFLDKFAEGLRQFLPHDRDIKVFLNSRPELIALCHWNANIDNAWFWRNADGSLEAGLLDWGSVSQMNVAQSVFGVLCACELDFLDQHRNTLIEEFLREFAAHGGAEIDRDEFQFHYNLFVAVLGTAWMIDAPSIIEAQLPHLAEVKDRFDPAFSSDFLSRAQLQLMLAFMNEWYREDLGEVVKRFVAMGDRG